MRRLAHLPLLLFWALLALVAARSIAAERHFEIARALPSGTAGHEEALRRTLRWNPAHGFALAALGREAVGRRDWATGILLTQAGLKRDFTLDIQKQLASALTQAQRLDDAVALFRDILVYLPNDPESLYRLAKIHFDREDYEEAADLSRRHLESHFPTAEICYMLGISLQKLDRPRQSMHYIHRFLLLARSDVLPAVVYEYDWANYLQTWATHIRAIESGRVRPGAAPVLE